MIVYLIKRLLILLPTLLVISIIIFFISLQAPGDPALIMLSQQSATGDKNEGINRQLVLEKRKSLGLDKAIFYLDFSTKASFQNLRKIPFERERNMVKNLSIKSGRPDLVKKYYSNLLEAPESNTIHALLGEDETEIISLLLKELPNDASYHDINSAFLELQNEKSIYNNFIPILIWNGTDNQYHTWLMNLARGDFGISFTNGLEVSQRLWEALKNTLSITIIALLLSFISSTLLAVVSIFYQNSFLPSLLNFIFFSLYSIPNFVIASLAIIIFGSSVYLDLFPVYGMGDYTDSMGMLEKAAEYVSHLFLPIFCLAYIPTAYLYQQLYGNLKNSMQKEYMMVARSKGLSRMKVITKHGIRNSILPMISYLSVIFPAVIGGSFVIEYIFSIPGMGVLTMDAVFARDYPVVFATLIVASFAALIGALLSDLLLMVFDPRISIDKS